MMNCVLFLFLIQHSTFLIRKIAEHDVRRVRACRRDVGTSGQVSLLLSLCKESRCNLKNLN